MTSRLVKNHVRIKTSTQPDWNLHVAGLGAKHVQEPRWLLLAPLDLRHVATQRPHTSGHLFLPVADLLLVEVPVIIIFRDFAQRALGGDMLKAEVWRHIHESLDHAGVLLDRFLSHGCPAHCIWVDKELGPCDEGLQDQRQVVDIPRTLSRRLFC